MFYLFKKSKYLVQAPQTLNRKWGLEKMLKTDLGKNGKKIFQKI